MKVQDITVFIVGNPPPGFGGRYFIFVKLTTDSGITGIGEIYCDSFGPQVIKAMAEDVRKVLASAVANAENNHNLDVDALVVSEASVGKSLSMKRFATRARGRSSRIVKPFSRIRVVVREQEEA